MIVTELKFARVLEEVDNLEEQLSDLLDEQDSIFGDCHDEIENCHGEDDLSDEAEARNAEIEKEAGIIQNRLDELQLLMDLNGIQFDIMRNSSIVNRWEIYARMFNAKRVPLKSLITGR